MVELALMDISIGSYFDQVIEIAESDLGRQVAQAVRSSLLSG